MLVNKKRCDLLEELASALQYQKPNLIDVGFSFSIYDGSVILYEVNKKGIKQEIKCLSIQIAIDYLNNSIESDNKANKMIKKTKKK